MDFLGEVASYRLLPVISCRPLITSIWTMIFPQFTVNPVLLFLAHWNAGKKLYKVDLDSVYHQDKPHKQNRGGQALCAGEMDKIKIAFENGQHLTAVCRGGKKLEKKIVHPYGRGSWAVVWNANNCSIFTPHPPLSHNSEWSCY